jgi:hypothetical protein
VSDLDEVPTSGKGRATPKRTQARVARAQQRKSAPVDRKAQSAARRRAMQEAREAMNQTDVSKLPAGERVPELVYVRDLVDSRFYVSQALIGIMVAVLVLGFIPIFGTLPSIVGLAALIVILPIGVLDARKIQAKVRDRFPTSTVPVRFYAFRRMFSPRRLRKPVPRVARGTTIA